MARYRSTGTSAWKPGVWLLLLVLLTTTSGCVTTLGWVPDNVKPRKLSDSTTLTPNYTEVKQWAYDVQDAYDSRATMNRQAAYFGALFAVAAAGAEHRRWPQLKRFKPHAALGASGLNASATPLMQ